MHRLILCLALLASPAFSGGPVIIETETAPAVRDRDATLPLVLLGLAVAAVVLGGGSDNCNSGEPTDGGKC